MTPEQEADIRAKARRLQQLKDELSVIRVTNVAGDADRRLAVSEERALLEVEAQRAYFELRAAQDAAAKEGTTP